MYFVLNHGTASLLLYLSVPGGSRHDAGARHRLRDFQPRFPARRRMGAGRARQFPVDGRPERNRSFGPELAGKPAGANVDASLFVTKGTLFASALISELSVSDDGSFHKREASLENARGQDSPGMGAYSVVSMLIETGHSYFGVGRGVPALCFPVAYSYRCIYNLCS